MADKKNILGIQLSAAMFLTTLAGGLAQSHAEAQKKPVAAETAPDKREPAVDNSVNVTITQGQKGGEQAPPAMSGTEADAVRDAATATIERDQALADKKAAEQQAQEAQVEAAAANARAKAIEEFAPKPDLSPNAAANTMKGKLKEETAADEPRHYLVNTPLDQRDTTDLRFRAAGVYSFVSPMGTEDNPSPSTHGEGALHMQAQFIKNIIQDEQFRIGLLGDAEGVLLQEDYAKLKAGVTISGALDVLSHYDNLHGLTLWATPLAASLAPGTIFKGDLKAQDALAGEFDIGARFAEPFITEALSLSAPIAAPEANLKIGAAYAPLDKLRGLGWDVEVSQDVVRFTNGDHSWEFSAAVLFGHKDFTQRSGAGINIDNYVGLLLTVEHGGSSEAKGREPVQTSDVHPEGTRQAGIPGSGIGTPGGNL